MSKSNGKKEWVKQMNSVITKTNEVRAEMRSKRVYVSPVLLNGMGEALFTKKALPSSETDSRSWCIQNGAFVVSVDSIVHPNHAKKVSTNRPENTVRARIQTFVFLLSEKAVMKKLNQKEKNALALVKSLAYVRFVQNGSPTATDPKNADAKKVFLVRKN